MRLLVPTQRPDESQSIWSYILLFVTYILVFFILPVPLTGVLVRWRANYTPKGIRIIGDQQREDVEEAAGLDPEHRVGPVVSSYFGMFRRVYWLEGAAGLFKGIVPMLTFRTLVRLCPTPDRYNKDNHIPLYDIRLDDLAYLLFIFVLSVVTMTIVYRAIVSDRIPHFLRRTTSTMHMLLTPFELNSTLSLFKAPGLSSAWLLYISIIIFYAGPEHKMLSLMALDEIWRAIVSRSHPVPERGYYIVAWLAHFVGLSFVSVMIMTPLEVVLVRLSVQRNKGPESWTGGDAGPHPLITASGEEVPRHHELDITPVGADDLNTSHEDVINVHPDDEPYNGLVDCVKRIVEEEGWKTLFRGWWMTLLFRGFLSSLI